MLPVVVILIFIDNFVDQLNVNEVQNWTWLSALKFVVAIPFVLFVIYSLSKILDYKLEKTKKALLTSEEMFRIVFERNTAAIMIIETDTTISTVNDAFCNQLGYTREEIEGTSWTNLMHEGDRERMIEYNRLRINKFKDVPDVYEFRFLKKGGEVRFGLMSVFYDSLLNQIVASFNDITERKEMELSLQESREEYRKLVEMQGEGLAIVDKEERFLFTNPAADKMMGVPIGGLIGKKVDDFVTKSTLDDVKKQTQIRAEGNQSTYEMEILRADGEKRVVLVTATPTFDDAGEFLSSLGIFIDITDRKNIENELKKNESALKALNTTKDKLFSIIAHDLRGPIGTSADLIDVLIDNFDTFSREEQLQMLDILKNSARSTYSLLETLLNWSIIQTGNLVFKPELFSLTNSIDALVKNMALTAYSKNIRLVFNPQQDIFVHADQNMIQTVLRNLISNAIKYTYREGEIEVKVRISGDRTEVSVCDNGMGMDETTCQNLFVLNGQHSKYGTENEKGTGLGLILCKEFIEKHGGSIRVESEQGKGSCFIFDIPNATANSETPSTQKNQNQRMKFNGEVVLIVEDDEINYQVLKSMLHSVNLKSERALTGKEAVSMFLSNPYQLILLDIQLPEMNGWDATMKIREHDAAIPIIAVTAYATDPSRKKSLEAGCTDFITKPINKAKLMQMVGKYLPHAE